MKFARGARTPAIRRRRRNRPSRLLLLPALPVACMCSALRRRSLPERWRWRAAIARVFRTSMRRRNLASSIALASSYSQSRSSARSTSVRGTVVTARPSRVVRSDGGRCRVKCTITPSSRPWCRRGTTTWIGPSGSARRPILQRSAAVERASTASGPTASSAAQQRVCHDNPGWPTAYTPRCTRNRRPCRTRSVIPALLTPQARSWCTVTTPCCRAANPEIARSEEIRFRWAEPTFLALGEREYSGPCGSGIRPASPIRFGVGVTGVPTSLRMGQTSHE